MIAFVVMEACEVPSRIESSTLRSFIFSGVISGILGWTDVWRYE